MFPIDRLGDVQPKEVNWESGSSVFQKKHIVLVSQVVVGFLRTEVFPVNPSGECDTEYCVIGNKFLQMLGLLDFLFLVIGS
jgi:hypothetical protein